MLVTVDGKRCGSISGGCLEEDVLARAARIAVTGRAELAIYDTTAENDLVWGVGLGCHGIVQVFLEKLPAAPRWAGVLAENLRSHRPTSLAVIWEAEVPAQLGTYLAAEMPRVSDDAGVFLNTIDPPPSLFVFGGGDDARPLVRLAKELGWRITVADPRPAFATVSRFPTADAIVTGPAAELVARAAPPPDALAVVMTHHYVHDLPLLRDLLRRPLSYLGLLGPKQRAEKILTDLGSNGVRPDIENRARLHAPVGLDLGAVNPEEVALSMMAEMCAALSGRDARPLRERTRPIHDVFAPQKPNLSESAPRT